MQVAILCGGKGRRIRGDHQGVPKGLVRIGSMPILWHIMKYYAYFGFNDFVLATGYRAEAIESFFKKERRFRIQCVDTGLGTNTGGRIKLLEPYLRSDTFCVTYGDGLSDANITSLVKFHKAHRKVATLMAVPYRSNFGILEINPASCAITRFREKPLLDLWVNGGFFVFQRKIFEYLRKNDTLEKETFNRLLTERQICAFKHQGFWKCLDTYKDELELNSLWLQGKAKWRVW